MADPIMLIAITGTVASLGSSIYTLIKRRQERAGESVTIVIRKPDGSEVRVDNVPQTAVAAIERQAAHAASK